MGYELTCTNYLNKYVPNYNSYKIWNKNGIILWLQFSQNKIVSIRKENCGIKFGFRYGEDRLEYVIEDINCIKYLKTYQTIWYKKEERMNKILKDFSDMKKDLKREIKEFWVYSNGI